MSYKNMFAFLIKLHFIILLHFFNLLFRDGNRRMVIIMPNQRVTSLFEIKRRFTQEIEKWRASIRKNFVTITMPTFKVV